MFTIDKNLSIPAAKKDRKASPLHAALQSMQIGDSIFVPFDKDKPDNKHEAKKILAAATYYRKKSKKTFQYSVRTVIEQGQHGMRMWRVPTSDTPTTTA